MENLSLLLPREATVTEALQQIKSQVKLDSEAGSGRLRLLEIWSNKIHKVANDEEPIIALNDYAKLRAEEIPKEELVVDEGDKKIVVGHFHRELNAVAPHGNPFFVIVKRDETVEHLKERIQRRLAVPDEEFSKWKCAIVSFGRPEYLQDSEVLAKHEFTTTDYLGLEHADTTPRQQYRPHFEKPIKIYG